MQVPKAFTPNGDGKNDEFRVAYRSLKTFKCWVFNRWGRKIYYWEDPQKGWNGTHNGRKLRAGAYIYIIEAKGTDNVDHSTKGVINMLTDSK
jgi:gliding motility-associated-like protein